MSNSLNNSEYCKVDQKGKGKCCIQFFLCQVFGCCNIEVGFEILQDQQYGNESVGNRKNVYIFGVDQVSDDDIVKQIDCDQ